MSETAAIDRDENTYESLAAKLADFATTLSPEEASALVLLIEHAKEHAAEVTGFEFTPAEEDEVSGYSFSFGAPGTQGALLPAVNQSMHGLGQFGRIGGSYMPQFLGGSSEWGQAGGGLF